MGITTARSSRSPRRTSAPKARTAAAAASDQASPTTWCPAWISSGTTAEAMWPLAPVMKTRMRGKEQFKNVLANVDERVFELVGEAR